MKIRFLAGLVPALVLALSGCADSKKAEVPTQLVDLPGKDGAGPKEGGTPKGTGDKGKAKANTDTDS